SKEQEQYSIPREIKKMSKATIEISERAVTLLHGTSPGMVLQNSTIFLPRTKWLKGQTSTLGDYLKKRGCQIQEHFYPIQIDPAEASSLAGSSKTEWNIVVVTNTRYNPGQGVLLQRLLDSNKQVAVINGWYPLDDLPQGPKMVIAAYWTAPPALEAAAGVL